MEAIARKGFGLLYIEAEYEDCVFCLVTVDGWFNRRFTAASRDEAIEKYMKGDV